MRTPLASSKRSLLIGCVLLVRCTAADDDDAENSSCAAEDDTCRNPSAGGWNTTYTDEWAVGEHRCNIDRIQESELTSNLFFAKYWKQQPLVIVRNADKNKRLRFETTKSRLLASVGDERVDITSLESHAFEQPKSITIADHVATFPHYNYSADTLGKDLRMNFRTDLGFGRYYEPIADLFATTTFGRNVSNADADGVYLPSDAAGSKPKTFARTHPIQIANYQFALGGSGVGLPFHVHTDAFAETLHGRRRWFLYSMAGRPVFHPRRTTAHWIREVYTKDRDQDDGLYECTIPQGEAIYVPAAFWHSTLSLGDGVSISAFLKQEYQHVVVPQPLSAAVKYIEERLLEQPLSVIWWSHYGEMSMRLEKPKRAFNALTRCLELNPLYSACRLWRRVARKGAGMPASSDDDVDSSDEGDFNLLTPHADFPESYRKHCRLPPCRVPRAFARLTPLFFSQTRASLAWTHATGGLRTLADRPSRSRGDGWALLVNSNSVESTSSTGLSVRTTPYKDEGLESGLGWRSVRTAK